MRRVLPLVLLTITACASGFFAGNRSRESREAALRNAEHSRDSIGEFEPFDRPDAAAEFWAMKRGITPGMDVAARQSLGAAVRGLAARGSAVVIATHDADLVTDLADRTVAVRNGRAVGLPVLGPLA